MVVAAHGARADHHMSYPFVFEHDGAIYMLPENGEAGRIELHRAVEFPYDWRLERVLLDGLTALDATLHAEDGLLWLFAHIIGGPHDAGELWLFSARVAGRRVAPTPPEPDRDRPGHRPAGWPAVQAGRRPDPTRPGLLAPVRRGCRPEPGRTAVAGSVPRIAGGQDRARLDAGGRAHTHLHLRLALRVSRRVPPRPAFARRTPEAHSAREIVIPGAGLVEVDPSLVPAELLQRSEHGGLRLVHRLRRAEGPR